MSKVEMDMTEYEAIKGTEVLLREALLRENKLFTTIQELNKEKITIMEQNEKSVTITQQTEITQIIYSNKSDEDIIRYITNLAHQIDRGSWGHQRTLSSSGLVDSLINNIFIRSEARESPAKDKRVVYKGLDEVKNTLTLEIETSLKLLYKDKVARLASLEDAHKELFKNSEENIIELGLLREHNDSLRVANLKLGEDKKDLEESLKKANEKVSEIARFLNNIKYQVNTIGILSIKSAKKAVVNAIENWKK